MKAICNFYFSFLSLVNILCPQDAPEMEKERAPAYFTFPASCCAHSAPSNLDCLPVGKRFLRIEMETFPSRWQAAFRVHQVCAFHPPFLQGCSRCIFRWFLWIRNALLPVEAVTGSGMVAVISALLGAASEFSLFSVGFKQDVVKQTYERSVKAAQD